MIENLIRIIGFIRSDLKKLRNFKQKTDKYAVTIHFYGFKVSKFGKIYQNFEISEFLDWNNPKEIVNLMLNTKKESNIDILCHDCDFNKDLVHVKIKKEGVFNKKKICEINLLPELEILHKFL